MASEVNNEEWMLSHFIENFFLLFPKYLSPSDCYDIAVKNAFCNPEKYDLEQIENLRRCFSLFRMGVFRSSPEFQRAIIKYPKVNLELMKDV